MKELTWTEQIDYLVNRKFPFSKAPPPIQPIGRHSGSLSGVSNHELHQKQISEIKSYKDELFKKPIAEIKSLYELEKNKEIEAIKLKIKLDEQSRFFNLDYANADFVHWSKAAHWSLDEALALSFGKSPDFVSWDKVKPFTNISAFAKDYEKRRDLALRSLQWKKLFDPMLPTIFISWAKELDIELPDELISHVQKRLGVAVNWFEEYRKIKEAYDELKKENLTSSTVTVKPLISHETNLLKIQSLAISEFYEPRRSVDPKKDEVTAWIISKGNGLNIPVSTNIADAIFTIIKPDDHNPKIKRAQPLN